MAINNDEPLILMFCINLIVGWGILGKRPEIFPSAPKTGQLSPVECHLGCLERRLGLGLFVSGLGFQNIKRMCENNEAS